MDLPAGLHSHHAESKRNRRRFLSGVSGALLILWLPATSLGAANRFDHSHALWESLLVEYVTWTEDGHASVVRYSDLGQDPRLTEYLATLSDVTIEEFRAWSRQRQLAFLINTYNAYTVALVSSRYPVDSIRDIGGWSSPWTYDFIPLFGTKVSLDHIEHGLIRGKGDYPGYDDYRIHFAVNCASIGCPALRPEAYTFDRLEDQLRDAEQRFLSDRSRNRYEPGRGVLIVSPIFEWYAEDFEEEFGTVENYFRSKIRFLTDRFGNETRSSASTLSVEFGTYDWQLNDGAR